MKKFLAILLAAMMLVGCGAASAPEAQGEALVEPESSAAQFDEEVDVLVVGAGGAGMCAAIEAKNAGVEKVLVIDKQEKLNSLTYLCEGILSGYEDQIAKKHDVHETAQHCFDQMMRSGKWRADPALTWITAEECGNLIDWLIDEVNVPFKDVCEVNPGYGPLALIHYVEGKGAGLRQPFLDKLEAIGVELRMSNRAVELIGNETHKEVIGAKVETADGVKTVKADAVVLCTGGYADSPEMIGRVNPGTEYMITMRPNGPSTGDGIILASEFGAMMHNMDRTIYGGGDYSSNPNRLNGMMMLDAKGARFKDERGHYAVSRDSYRVGMQSNGVDYYWVVGDAASTAASEGDQTAVEKNPNIIVADTLAELAEKTGMDAAVLEETVAAWNKGVEAGKDEAFDRNPETMAKLETAPYYAMKAGCRAGFTYGGIARNENGEVLNYRGTTIPGLYVGGEAAVAACDNGWTMSHAMTWGRIAGKSAAAYAMAH